MEGAGVDGLQGKEKREGSQRSLSAREQGQRLQPFSRRLGQDLHPLVQRAGRLLRHLQAKGGAPALEEFLEELLEIGGHRLEDRPKAAVDVLLQVLSQLNQLRRGGLEILQLTGQALAPAP